MASLWSKISAVLPASEADFPLQFSDTVQQSVVEVLKWCRRQLYSGATSPGQAALNAQIVLDVSWEKLNMGTWRHVDKEWRRVYSYGCLFKVAALCHEDPLVERLLQAVRTCDLGLLMGAAIMDDILQVIVRILQSEIRRSGEEEHQRDRAEVKRIKTESPHIPEIKDECAVPRIKCPSLETFKTSFLIPLRPVILEGIIDHWPALNKHPWSVEYLRSVAGCRTVPVEVGSRYTDENWSQTLLTVDEFIDKYILKKDGGNVSGYLAQHQLFEQVVGSKYIRLYSPEDTDRLYPHQSQLLHNTSQVEVESPDFERFPEFAVAPYLECVLWPGDVLFIPVRHWHYVRSLELSFSVSFWWS
ncbi:lysine-specific demethylase 8 isoform 2-T3 [Pholidichthys leucotaenia]